MALALQSDATGATEPVTAQVSELKRPKPIFLINDPASCLYVPFTFFAVDER